MNNFKSGSGNLDFGSGDDNDDTESEEADTKISPDDVSERGDTHDTGQSPVNETDSSTELESEAGTDENGEDPQEYPYFIRRSNVGDERDNRIELHLRKTVSSQESDFRSELAECLDTGEVPKTDAREFALKFAFQNPEGVAKLMREEGFGLLD
ncbi:acyl-CoA dehydrogenase [Natrialba sp. INN-245]|uniref:acyl-CoA dehydrogenase n=1 Tax=Natrialba sp. INN-245 TaxID=2690967 RepID=UPI001311810A|nr:acyl-CoA dehydrogenase [Natrialba sp. INN-245]MWV38806.1 acyl-CoA dehydrogenase [Natrialba sp. INN-245]